MSRPDQSTAHVPYTVEVLRDIPGFADASIEVLEAIAERFELSHPSSGWVCREGENGDAIYLLGEGALEVVKESAAGRTYVVATLTPGVLFGHVSMVTGNPRTASVRCTSKATLLTLPGVALRELLRHGPFVLTSPLRRAMIVAMSRQLSSATQTAMELAIEAGIAETSTYEELTAEVVATGEHSIPADAEARIVRFIAQP